MWNKSFQLLIIKTCGGNIPTVEIISNKLNSKNQHHGSVQNLETANTFQITEFGVFLSQES